MRRLGTNAVSNAIGYAIHYSRSADAVIRVYEVRPRKDKRGVDLISDTLPFWLPMVLKY